MKRFCWDFNGTLEEGSDVSYTESINHVLKEIGSEKRVSVEEVRKLFGNPSEVFVHEFFPPGTDVSSISRRIDEANLRCAKQYIKPRYGAIETLRQIKQWRGLNLILSHSSQELLDYYVKLWKLDEVAEYIASETYLKKLRTFLNNEDFLRELAARGRSEETEKLNMRTEEFKPYWLYWTARSRWTDLTVMVGDAYQDMEAVEIAKKLLNNGYDNLQNRGIVVHRKRVIGVLFDPDNSKQNIPCDYRIRHLIDVIGLFY